MENLEKKTVAILATDGFEESELREPKKALEEAGADVHIVSLKTGEIKGWDNGNWSNAYKVDKTLDEVSQSSYNALMLPGGVINPDILRRNDKAVDFIKNVQSYVKTNYRITKKQMEALNKVHKRVSDNLFEEGDKDE